MAAPTVLRRPGPLLAAATSLTVTAVLRAAAPGTAPAVPAECTAVHRGTLALSFDAAGVIEPVDPFRVRFDLLRYTGALAVRKAAPDGSAVAKGDLLLAVDTDPIDRQIAAAESAATVARAAVAKAQADVRLGERSDALAMDTARQAAADADAGLKRYDQTDAPAAVASAGLQVKEADAALDDATDELEQLRQMYKSEDLTNQTADIVLKRAARQQELYKATDRLTKVLVDRATTYEPTVRRHAMAAGAAAQAGSAEELAATQALARVTRSAAVMAARAAADDADRAVSELKRDRDALTVTSPVDGVLAYGTFADKAWQPIDPDKLAAGRKVQADQPLMTVYRPGRVRVVAACRQSDLRLMPPGTPVEVRTDVLPDAVYAGTCGPAGPATGGAKRDATVDVPVTLPAVDARLLPGLSAALAVDVPPATDVLLVPATAVYHGRVCVRDADGTVRPTPVGLGQRTEKQVQIRTGLHDGDVVLTTYKE